MVKLPPPTLDLIINNPGYVRKLNRGKRARKPTTFPYLKAERGVDKAKGAWSKTPGGGPVKIDNLPPKPQTLTLGLRHQTLIKYVVKKLMDRDDLKVSLYMGGGKYIFVREEISATERRISASIVYSSLSRALHIWADNEVYYDQFQTIPI